MPENSSFTTRLHVHFGDVDAAGIVYFPRTFDLIHRAFETLWETHVGQRYYDLICGDRIGFPLVHSEVDFRRPLRFGHDPEVTITCLRMGRSSLVLRYVFSADGEVAVDARMTVVCVHMDDLSSRPIPAHYRKKFERIRAAEERPADTER